MSAAMYNAGEIYEMGIEIEKNGREFYRIAAKQTKDPDAKKLFDRLMKWEDNHVSLFQKLRNELPQNTKCDDIYDPENDMHGYIKSVADSHVFLGNVNVAAMVNECKDIVSVLKLAERFEKDSVVLYMTMKDLVSEDMGRESITRLANEEIAHVSFIQKQLSIVK